MFTKTRACLAFGYCYNAKDISSSHDVACVMAYIIDLTIVMHRLSAVDISEESVLSTLKDYARSAEVAQVHNDIRTFCGHASKSRLRDKEYVLEETTRLIEKHQTHVPWT